MSSTLGQRTVEELEEERDFLLRSLDDLEAERAAGDIEEADYLALKDDYTARTAAVLRALEAAEPPPVEDQEPAPRRHIRKVAIALAVLAFAVGAGVVVARSAGERLPGDPATGDIASTGPSTDLSRDLARARQLIGEGRTLDAIKLYDEVLSRHPQQVEALAYRGWLVRLAGQQVDNRQLLDRGFDYVSRAVAADPGYPDAHFFRGFMLYEDRADPAGAVAEFKAFLANDPPRDMVPLVEGVLRRAEADAGARAASPSTSG